MLSIDFHYSHNYEYRLDYSEQLLWLNLILYSEFCGDCVVGGGGGGGWGALKYCRSFKDLLT